MSIVVGAHPQNISLSLLARRQQASPTLRKHDIRFFVYGAGSQTIQLFETGVLQFGGTGATPPILAKSQGLGVAVVGMSDPRHERGGLLVRADSPFHKLEDLRDQGIGLMPLSWHQQFLAAELEAAGLSWHDVVARDIIPATAADAFIQGLLPAIVATDPLYAKIATTTPVRVLAAPGGTFSNRSVYWGRHDLLRRQPEAVRALLHALVDSDRQVGANPQEAASLLDGLNGWSASDWLKAIQGRNWGVYPPDETFLQEQQDHADLFAHFGLIPAPIDVSDTVDASLLTALPA